MSVPVLIIGAGPVGMTLACELARFGVGVRIVDKAAQRTDKSKALVLWSRTLELLDRGGHAGAAPFIDAGFKATGINFVAGEKVVGRLSMDGVRSPCPFGLMLPQSETERLLEERLNSVGVVVERNVELISFSSTSTCVSSVLRHAEGREETVSADWLVGCDGAHSAVRHGLNAPFEGESLKSDWMLADIRMTGYPYPDTDASIVWHRDGAFVIFPISPGRYRILADLPLTAGEKPPTPTLQEVQAIIDRRGPHGMIASDPIWLAGFRINGRKVSSYRYGRVFLAGDAAHVHSPAGGQGMNTGMQDAFNLAWKLAMAIKSNATDSLLDSYSPERSAIGDEVLKTAGRITTVGTLKNPVMQVVRNLVGQVLLGLSPFQHALADTITEVSVGYPASPLNGPSIPGVSPKAGERVMPVAGQPPIGSGTTPRFALFAESTPAVAELLETFKEVIEQAVRPPLHEGGLWLVRPDGYVASSSTGPESIAKHLSAVLE